MNRLSVGDADRIIRSRPASDGDGVKIKRIAGQHLNAYLDPFLLIDEIDLDESTDNLGGFPAHPHRGFQTLTYMLKGRFHHEDSMGNRGMVDSGGLQWMSAASGVIHSEMPEPEDSRLHGFQLWLNLPASEKMRAPDYLDIQGHEVESHTLSGGVVTPIVGKLTVGEQAYVGVLDLPESHAVVARLALSGDQSVTLNFPSNRNINLLLINGELAGLKGGEMAHYSARGENSNVVINSLREGAEILILAGEPIREPIAQYGPFVMNDLSEVEQALRDYRDNTLVK